jgi:hypothetical protein
MHQLAAEGNTVKTGGTVTPGNGTRKHLISQYFPESERGHDRRRSRPLEQCQILLQNQQDVTYPTRGQSWARFHTGATTDESSSAKPRRRIPPKCENLCLCFWTPRGGSQLGDKLTGPRDPGSVANCALVPLNIWHNAAFIPSIFACFCDGRRRQHAAWCIGTGDCGKSRPSPNLIPIISADLGRCARILDDVAEFLQFDRIEIL